MNPSGKVMSENHRACSRAGKLLLCQSMQSVLQVQPRPLCGVSKGQKFGISPERLHSVLCGNQISSSPKAAPPFEGSHSSRCLV